LYSESELILSIANYLYYFRNYELAGKLYERAEEISLKAFSPTDLAVYCDFFAKNRNYGNALPICFEQEQSSARCKDKTLATRQTITGIYKGQGNWSKVAEYSRKIIQC
jgi:hypothetical protein